MTRETRGFEYDVEGSVVFVCNRPPSLETDAKEFTAADKADAYLSVTDTFVVAPADKPFVWFPWNEGRMPIPEMFYGCNRSLIWWIHYQKLKRVHVFCDGGTHRSVTVFGAFLLTYYGRQKANEIVNARRAVNTESGHCDPIDYIDGYLKQFPEDLVLFQEMGKNWLGRLEELTKTCVDRVKKRLGDNRYKEDL